jgi:hypothetical protein
MDKDKIKKKLMEALETIQELYPHLDRVMVTDLEDPRSIIITSDDVIDEIAEDFGLDPETIDELREDIEIEVDIDDDDDRGPLQ